MSASVGGVGRAGGRAKQGGQELLPLLVVPLYASAAQKCSAAPLSCPFSAPRRYMAIKGLHVPQNFTKAREHFQDAAAHDLPSALNGLGARVGAGPFQSGPPAPFATI